MCPILKTRSFLLLTFLASALLLAQAAMGNALRVDRASGQVTWENTSGLAFGTFGYEIRSDSGSLNPDAWLPITENGDADSGGWVDPNASWEVFANAPTFLAEFTLDGVVFLREGDVLDLGTGLWKASGQEDLTFAYFDDLTFELTPAPVEFFGELPPLSLPGDYNANGTVEQADLDLVLLNWGQSGLPENWVSDLPQGPIDQAELDRVLLNWGNTSAAAIAAAAVPEPSTTALLTVFLTGLAWASRQAAKAAASRYTRGVSAGNF